MKILLNSLFVLLSANLLCSCGSSDQIKAYCQYSKSTITYTHQEIYKKAAIFLTEEVKAQGSALVLPGGGDIDALAEFMMTSPLCIDCSLKYSAWSDPPMSSPLFMYQFDLESLARAGAYLGTDVA